LLVEEPAFEERVELEEVLDDDFSDDLSDDLSDDDEPDDSDEPLVLDDDSPDLDAALDLEPASAAALEDRLSLR
jgi:hypothetical protein